MDEQGSGLTNPSGDLPLVSVVTPSYNQGEFLETTIRSVLYQDYPRIEYIVVDGGSTDGSVEIIRKYRNRIARWLSEPDLGQADAINKGFRLARGEIVAWINSDDYYFPYAVTSAVQAFQADPKVAVFYGDGVLATRGGQFQQYFVWVEPFCADRLYSCSDYILQPTTFFRRDALFEAGLLDTSLHYVMDWDLWCRFAKKGFRFHYEPRPIAVNRVYYGTKTSTGGRKRLLEIYRLIRRYYSGFWPHGFFSYLAASVKDSDLPAFLKTAVQAILLIPGWRKPLNAVGQKPLYGMHRYSNNLCSRSVTIFFPLLKQARQLLLRFEVPFSKSLQDQSVEVTINGSHALTHRFVHDPGPQTISVPLHAGPREMKYLQLDLNFSHSTLLRTVRSLGRPLEVSARLKEFEIV